VEFGRTSDVQTFNPITTLSLWKEVQQFDDYDADILLAVIAQIIKTTDGQGSAWFWASQFLDNRDIIPVTKKEGDGVRRAGHRVENVARIEEGLQRIANLWVNIEEIIPPKRKGQKPKKFVHRGRLLMITETWTQEGLIRDGKPRLPIAWKIRAGDWLLEYLDAPRMVAYLCEQSLQYDPYRELWEKRLSRYFMFHLRINAQHASNMITRRVGLLIHDLSLPIDDRHPERTRNRFQQAMQTLVQDRQIDEWEYQEQEPLPARNWLNQWLEWKVTIHAMARLKGEEQ